MSGRIRSIKPELLEDAITAGLSHEAFRLFIGMILVADDHGNFRASPRWLEGQVFHAQPLTDGVTMETLFAELAKKLVLFYLIEGQPYASITGWRKHQRIENAGENRVPMPPGWECVREERSDGKRMRVRWLARPAAVTPPADSHLSGVATVATNDSSRPAQIATAGSRSPITDHDQRGEAAAAQPPPPTPAAPTRPRPAEVTVAELETGRDLYRPAYVDAAALLAAAVRIDRAIKLEPKAANLDKRAIVACAVAMARDHRAKFPSATDEAILAKVETSLEKYVLGDIRKGTWRAASQASGGGGRRNDVVTAEVGPDFERDEVAEMAKTQRAQAARNRQQREERDRDQALDRQRRSSRGALEAFPARAVFTPTSLQHGLGKSQDDTEPPLAAGAEP